jgi:hypothetical protein
MVLVGAWAVDLVGALAVVGEDGDSMGILGDES